MMNDDYNFFIYLILTLCLILGFVDMCLMFEMEFLKE